MLGLKTLMAALAGFVVGVTFLLACEFGGPFTAGQRAGAATPSTACQQWRLAYQPIVAAVGTGDSLLMPEGWEPFGFTTFQDFQYVGLRACAADAAQ